MKIYNAENGISLDDCFTNHLYNCATCKQFDAEKPATVALLCLEGAILWKRENGVKVTPEKPAKQDTVVSKADARKAMRYK